MIEPGTPSRSRILSSRLPRGGARLDMYSHRVIRGSGFRVAQWVQRRPNTIFLVFVFLWVGLVPVSCRTVECASYIRPGFYCVCSATH